MGSVQTGLVAMVGAQGMGGFSSIFFLTDTRSIGQDVWRFACIPVQLQGLVGCLLCFYSEKCCMN